MSSRVLRLGLGVLVGLAMVAGPRASPPAFAAEPKKVALLVGVNRYKARHFEEKPLSFAERDVRELAALLQEQGFEVRTLTGDVATKQRIDESVNALLKGRAATDLVLLAFSGHGLQMPLPEGGEDACFCPVDAVIGDVTTMVRLTELFQKLDRRGGINLFLVDACRDDFDPLKGRGGSTKGPTSLTGDTLNGQLPRNTAILFSCSARQQALETEKAGGGHGVFFHHVIEGLQGRASDLETGDVCWDDLVSFVRKNVNPSARKWDPERAKLADERTDGRLQTPHVISNLVDRPVLAHVDRDRIGGGFAESIGIRIVPIPSGEFEMGSSPAKVEQAQKLFPYMKKEWFEDEQPRHKVRITAIRGLSAQEVTVGQFRRFAEDMRYKTDAEGDDKGGSGYDAAKKQFVQDPRFTWKDPGFAQSDDHPVVNVSWNDATAFCGWLSRRDGRTYRLPREAEWEYCCRAGSRAESFFGNGDDPERLVEVGNVADASLRALASVEGAITANDHFAFTAPVGSFRPNEWGLFDMHGNVAEWCLDGYDAAYYYFGK
jgi:formylglycine-generating enzyme